MRSLIILEVEHGETTDPLNVVLSDLAGIDWVNDLKVVNSTVRVDIPDCFELKE